MKNISILITFILVLSQLSAQQIFEWGVKAGGANTDVINDITNIGNDIYLTGRFAGSFTSDNEDTKGTANNDIYLVRLNQKGATKWIRTLSGEGTNNATRITAFEKQLLLGGTISETVKQGKKQFTGEGKAVFISLWNEQGKTNWLTRLPYTGHATLDVLEVNPDGTLLAGGLLQGTMDVDGKELSTPKAKRAYIVTFSAEGKPQEATLSMGEGSHRLVSATFDKKGNQYQLFSVSGNFSMEKDSMITLSRSVKSAIILSKVSNNGETEWSQSITGTGYTEGVKVITDDNNQVLVCSNYNKELKSGKTKLSTDSQLETALFNFNETGQLMWAKTISSPVKARAMDILVTRNKNILVSGYFRQSYRFNDEEFFSETSQGDLFLLQFDTKGGLVWHDEPGQDAASFSKAFTLDQTGNIILAGGFKGELNLQGEKLESAGREDILIAKYFNCLQKEVAITGNEPLCEGGEAVLSVAGNFSTYQWNDEIWGDNEFVVTTPGTYFVTAFDQKGCAATDTIEVMPAEVPDLGLPGSIDIYKNEQILLTANEGFSSYIWEDGTDGAGREINYQPEMDSVQLYVIAKTFEGCSACDTVMVHFHHNGKGFRSYNSLAKAWPNPVEDNLLWVANIKKPKEVCVTLTDSKSVMISSETIPHYIPGTVQTINMATLASGNYLLTIKVGGAVYNQKIVKR